MRSACGSNDHLDSILFIQMFRLLSTYSLVKPPKGSNVSGGDIINTLLNIKDITNTNERAQRINQELDDILDKGHSEKIEIAPYIHDHEYSLTDTSSLVLSYLAGYVARKSTRFTKCQRCLLNLKNEVISSRDKLIDMRSKGFLIRPSDSLFALISTLEKITLKTLVSEKLNVNTIFSITSNLWTDTGTQHLYHLLVVKNTIWV
ncbi:unnamed protein product [Macrosiphum euphorbiae]|nr:unnamed protein product [Macrosiphum euphorbiae]